MVERVDVMAVTGLDGPDVRTMATYSIRLRSPASGVRQANCAGPGGVGACSAVAELLQL
jgi:hypothetical protein